MATTSEESKTTTLIGTEQQTTFIGKLVLDQNDGWNIEEGDGVKKTKIPKESLMAYLEMNEKPFKNIQSITIVKAKGSTCWYCVLPNGDLWELCIP